MSKYQYHKFVLFHLKPANFKFNFSIWKCYNKWTTIYVVSLNHKTYGTTAYIRWPAYSKYLAIYFNSLKQACLSIVGLHTDTKEEGISHINNVIRFIIR